MQMKGKRERETDNRKEMYEELIKAKLNKNERERERERTRIGVKDGSPLPRFQTPAVHPCS